MNLLDKLKINHRPRSKALDLLKYIGPGLLATVGSIDPRSWATNLATGSEFDHVLLWIVTSSSVMLIIIQHNVTHLGIVAGLCLSETTNKYMPRVLGRSILGSTMLVSVSTSLAEILGGAITLRMLFGMPIRAGAVIVTIVCLVMPFGNTYSKTEHWIVTFMSIIGFSFLYRLVLVDINWGQAVVGWVRPASPKNSMLIIISILGAVVMPHNLSLHSEIIQSREWNLEDRSVIKKQLRYEFYDILLSMVIDWAVSSAMIILAAFTFFKQNIAVNELDQVQQLLMPLVGNNVGVIFTAALLLADISSTITSDIAGASIFAEFYGEAYNHTDLHSKPGILLSFIPALTIIFLIGDLFRGLILSQMLLGVQLPIMVSMQVYLASGKKAVGVYASSRSTTIILLLLGTMVTILNIALLISLF